jgi:hypothetical protein
MQPFKYNPTIHHNQKHADLSVLMICQLMTEGYTYRAISQILNEEGYRTIRGILWSPENVRQVISKLRLRKDSWYGLAAERAGLVVKTVY